MLLALEGHADSTAGAGAPGLSQSRQPRCSWQGSQTQSEATMKNPPSKRISEMNRSSNNGTHSPDLGTRTSLSIWTLKGFLFYSLCSPCVPPFDHHPTAHGLAKPHSRS